ncbi:MAG TPA: hypothetical protein VFY84_06735 [Jiangellales bacterium]|nr:hypothetical protein [Jiangellales bacterium]
MITTIDHRPSTIDERVPGRRVHMVADAAYHGKGLRDLAAQISWTNRLPRNAGLYHRAPAPTGKRGRPRLKGDRIGTPDVARYGRSDTVSIAVLDCLWYGVFGPQPVRMVLIRDRRKGRCWPWSPPMGEDRAPQGWHDGLARAGRRSPRDHASTRTLAYG